MYGGKLWQWKMLTNDHKFGKFSLPRLPEPISSLKPLNLVKTISHHDMLLLVLCGHTAILVQGLMGAYTASDNALCQKML